MAAGLALAVNVKDGSDLGRNIKELGEGAGNTNGLMESKGGKKSSSSSGSNKSLLYEAPLGYSIEDVRPNGEFEKFRSAAYSNCVRKPS
ncbi:hypothetical protein SAY86_018769 [Trapa natans]|uniref:Uncharacterized protein n=1 Tax=Trapa natans TaxID=22666 RepID=A0AAN7LNU3_TRANT|nr:hypothetical protein SAY86_018769 [Trapa natans]